MKSVSETVLVQCCVDNEKTAALDDPTLGLCNRGRNSASHIDIVS